MDLLRSHLKTSLERYYSLEKQVNVTNEIFQNFYSFIKDRRNASMGDSLINFVYSCAKSISQDSLTGVKISDTILIEGYKQSLLSSWLTLPGKKKEQANALEALIFYLWLVHSYTIEEMSLLISQHLNSDLLNSSTGEQRTAIEGLGNLFDACHHLLYQEIE